MFWKFKIFPEIASLEGESIDRVFFFWVILSGTIVFTIFVLILYFVVKYRRGSAAGRIFPAKGLWKAEFLWTAFPLVINTGAFFWAAQVYYDISLPAKNTLPIYVVGKQWMWKFQHETGQREINELHLPVGRKVKLLMTSQDVIHSLFVPAFRIKQDLLPGRYTTMEFTPTRPGTYHLFCTEYCGTNHSRMDGFVYVMREGDFAKWLNASRGEMPLAGNGRGIYERLGCATCHREGRTAPRLEGIFGKREELEGGTRVVVDENYLRESILNPAKKIVRGFAPVMPSFKDRLNEDELLQLISYIKSLTKGSEGGGGK